MRGRARCHLPLLSLPLFGRTCCCLLALTLLLQGGEGLRAVAKLCAGCFARQQVPLACHHTPCLAIRPELTARTEATLPHSSLRPRSALNKIKIQKEQERLRARFEARRRDEAAARGEAAPAAVDASSLPGHSQPQQRGIPKEQPAAA